MRKNSGTGYYRRRLNVISDKVNIFVRRLTEVEDQELRTELNTEVGACLQ